MSNKEIEIGIRLFIYLARSSSDLCDVIKPAKNLFSSMSSDLESRKFRKTLLSSSSADSTSL